MTQQLHDILVKNEADLVQPPKQVRQKTLGKNFEILLIEDGSTQKCDQVAEEYKSKLEIKYFFKEN